MNPLTVLIVEDSPEFRMLYRRFLQRSTSQAFNVLEAATLQEASAVMQTTAIDCAVVDYHLPDGNGVSFIASLQEKGMLPKTSVLLATGQESDEVAGEAVRNGAAGCLSKTGLTKDFFIQSVLDAVKDKT